MSETHDWQEVFLESILSLTRDNVKRWCGVVNQLGMDCSTREKWVGLFTDLLQNTYSDVIEEVVNYQHALCDEIESLLKESSELCKVLNLQLPEYGSENLSLSEERRILKQKIEEYKLIISNKQKEIEKLNTKEKALCKSLNREEKPIVSSPLPSGDTIDDFKHYLEALEFEKFERLAKASTTKGLILDLVKELNYKPSLKFEEMVITCNESEFVLSDTMMLGLENFYEKLKNQLNDIKEQIKTLKEKIYMLWEKLEEDSKYCNDFSQQNAAGHNLTVLESLKAELNRCNSLITANIEKFIETSRKTITELWEKCHFTDEQRVFEFFSSDMLTEDVLTLHEIEIQNLRRYYSENEKIFELLEERKELWEKMKTLEDSANQPNRFKNRGGRLLKEEKERNSVSKRIPIIEEQLLVLSKAYQTRHNTPFQSWGKTIEEIVSADYAKHEEAKRLKLSARKLKRENTLTPAKSLTSFKTCSSMQNLQMTPMGKSVKRKICTPLFSSKRTRVLTENRQNEPKTAPPKLMLNGKPVGLNRLSIERKKRIAKCCKILRKSFEKHTLEANSSEYDVFQKAIENKENCRSTILLDTEDEISALAVPLPNTPRKALTGTNLSSNNVHSPHTRNNDNAKLTVAPPFKQLF